MLEAITARAALVCGAEDAVMRLVEGDVMRLAAHYGPVPDVAWERRINRQSPSGRALVDRKIIHIEHADESIATEYPEVVGTQQRVGAKTILAVPLMREGIALGVVHFRRIEDRPFSEKQITLVKTFADQAVIAIENTRLFQELQTKNRDLTEALEQQTATSEILRVIASSPTDIQPVLDTVIANAVTLAGAKQGHIRQYDGEFLRVVAHFNETAEQIAKLQATPTRPGLDSLSGHAFLAGKAQHILDAQAESEDEMFYQLHVQRELGMRTLMVLPLLRKGAAIGTISIWRDFVEAFTERQIDLVKTFADQAVIAIENVRLFKELEARNRDLTEALDQQTATSEVLKVISRSTFDFSRSLRHLLENATQAVRSRSWFHAPS